MLKSIEPIKALHLLKEFLGHQEAPDAELRTLYDSLGYELLKNNASNKIIDFSAFSEFVQGKEEALILEIIEPQLNELSKDMQTHRNLVKNLLLLRLAVVKSFHGEFLKSYAEKFIDTPEFFDDILPYIAPESPLNDLYAFIDHYEGSPLKKGIAKLNKFKLMIFQQCDFSFERFQELLDFYETFYQSIDKDVTIE